MRRVRTRATQPRHLPPLCLRALLTIDRVWAQAFCTLCMEAFHPGTVCMDPEERLKVLGERSRGNKDAGKEEKARHERLVQQALSLAHIKRNAKK